MDSIFILQIWIEPDRMSVMTASITAMNHHVLIRVQIKIALSLDLKIPLNDQAAIHWIIDNW